jgi:hypothetical protein
MKSTNIELVIAFFEELEREGFFGSVDITMQGGKFAHARKYESIQDFEVVAKNWHTFSEDVQKQFKDKFGTSAKFAEALRKYAPVLKTPEKLVR